MDLHEVVQKYPSVLKDRRLLRSVLGDLYPDETLLVNVVLDIHECGIAEQIRQIDSIDAAKRTIFIRQLEREYGLQESVALEGVKIWADAFDKPIDATCLKDGGQRDLSLLQPSNGDVSVEVKGNYKDFKIKKQGADWYIEQYLGTDEEQLIVPNTIGSRRIVGIGQDAYRGLHNLRTLCISEGILHIHAGAFAKCFRLESVKFPKTLLTVGEAERTRDCLGAFALTSLKRLYLPPNLTFIGKRAFACNYNLQVCYMNNAVSEIESEAFSECSRLEVIYLSRGLNFIGPRTFAGCSALKEMYIPAKTRISDEAFFPEAKKNPACPPGLTIFCQKGSRTMKYAQTEGIKWDVIPADYDEEILVELRDLM